jgi:hypothetical protein
MISQEFVTFQTFNDQVAALELAQIFKENNIEYEFENNAINFDASFAHSELAKEFRIKIQKEDFERADNLLQQISLSQLDSVAKDYYLYDFTDEELLDVVAKKDEWGQLNFVLAQKLLKERGKEVKPQEIELFKKERIEKLAKPAQNQQGMIYAGYIMAVLGGLFGLFIGWHLASYKRTLPNGDRVYAYPLEDRKQGNNIVILGVFCMLIWLIARFGSWK